MVRLLFASGWPVSRILSGSWNPVYARRFHPGPPAWAVISLGGLPGTGNEASSFSSLLALLPAGVAWPPALLRTPVVSYTAFSPSPLRAVCFCGPIRQVSPPRGFPGAVLSGVRTFLDCAPERAAATVQPA